MLEKYKAITVSAVSQELRDMYGHVLRPACRRMKLLAAYCVDLKSTYRLLSVPTVAIWRFRISLPFTFEFCQANAFIQHGSKREQGVSPVHSCLSVIACSRILSVRY